MGTALTILIPLVVLSYGVWLLVRMVRNRRAGRSCCGGCSGCPYASGCTTAKEKQTDE